MERPGDFEAYMKAAARRLDVAAGQCATDAQLMAHLRGTESADFRTSIESHLVSCPYCRQRLLDAQEFLEPDRPGEAVLTAVDIEQDWKLLGQRIGFVRERANDLRRAGWRSGLLAIAASILLALGFSAGWGVQYARQNSGVEQALRRAEDENRRSRQQLEADRQQLAQLRLPRVNTAIYDVFSNESLSRGAGKPQTNRIQLSNNKTYTLILNGQGQKTFSQYAAEIVDDRGGQVWRTEDLQRGSDRNFAVTFPPGFLTEGNYRLELSGKAPGGYQKIAEYVLSIQHEDH